MKFWLAGILVGQWSLLIDVLKALSFSAACNETMTRVTSYIVSSPVVQNILDDRFTFPQLCEENGAVNCRNSRLVFYISQHCKLYMQHATHIPKRDLQCSNKHCME